MINDFFLCCSSSSSKFFVAWLNNNRLSVKDNIVHLVILSNVISSVYFVCREYIDRKAFFLRNDGNILHKIDLKKKRVISNDALSFFL